MKKILISAVLFILSFSLCACSDSLTRAELDSFMSLDAEGIRDGASSFDAYLMTYTTIMYSRSEKKYLTFEVSTVLDTVSGILCSEIKLDGSSYTSFFVKDSKVYFDTVMGEIKKIVATEDAISDFRHFTDVASRLDSALFPLTLSAKELRRLGVKVQRVEDGDNAQYVFSLGRKYFNYAYENAPHVFDKGFTDGITDIGKVGVDSYMITYVTDSDGKLVSVSEVNKFTVKRDGESLNYEAGISIRKYEGTLDFDESEYSDSSSGEYINNYKDGNPICQ